MRVPRGSIWWCWLGAGLLTACGSSGAPTPFPNPTYIAVDPTEFTPGASCLTAAADAGGGELQSYAAVLLRLSEGQGATKYSVIATSPVSSCRDGIRFEVPTDTIANYDARYAADLFGFALPSSSVAKASGEPKAQAAQLRQAATWLGSCGRGVVDSQTQADAGPLEFELDHGELVTDSGAVGTAYGPKRPAYGRTVTLRGCALEPLLVESGDTGQE